MIAAAAAAGFVESPAAAAAAAGMVMTVGDRHEDSAATRRWRRDGRNGDGMVFVGRAIEE